MNAVEIEQAISDLAEQPFDAENFPYAFLEAFGNKETVIKRLKSGGENKSDVQNGVLQRNNIHIAVCKVGETNAILDALRASSATDKFKAKFILATDGVDFEAEDLNTGETEEYYQRSSLIGVRPKVPKGTQDAEPSYRIQKNFYRKW